MKLIPLLSLLSLAALAGCATPPPNHSSLFSYTGPETTDSLVTSGITPTVSTIGLPSVVPSSGHGVSPRTEVPIMRAAIAPNHRLAGRVLAVSHQKELVLADHEVIITFDDGPRPDRTNQILDVLKRYGVKATFLMVGNQADKYPAMVARVFKEGHAIGSHTFDHADLSKLSEGDALAQMRAGHQAVSNALADLGQKPSRFFRFPYLAQTGVIRANAIQHDFIVLDVDVDSKDYYKDGAEAVLNRTLESLEARGKGVILFHDIHERTAEMLPHFLGELQVRGYKVVNLQSTEPREVFNQPLVTADSPSATTNSL